MEHHLHETTMKTQEELSAIIDLAERIATEAHAGQFRRDGVTPYIEHPRKVAEFTSELMFRYRQDADFSQFYTTAVAGAWLHDVLEDTPLTADELIRRGVPRAVVDCVEFLTKQRGQDYWTYLSNLSAMGTSKIVKFADMLANFNDQPTPKQRSKYIQGFASLLGY